MKDSLIYRFMFFTTIVVVVIMSMNFIWDYKSKKTQAIVEMHEKAEVITEQLIATREVIAKNQDLINYDSQGNFEFKHLNPAAVGMEICEVFGKSTNYSIKQTRIDYRNEKNAPDSYEIQGLKTFQNDPSLREIWGEDVIEGKKVFRYMVPLEIKEECLDCHGEPAGTLDISGYEKEGYQVGNLGGAISLVMPTDIFVANIRTNVYRHLGFSLLLIAVILISMYFLVTRLVLRSLDQLQAATAQIGRGNLDIDMSQIKAQGEIKQLAEHFQVMASQLKDLYTNLESKVEQRTKQFAEANEGLKIKQQELEAANIKLNEVNKHKSEFLAIMSHELRTPLTSIMAFTELLLNDVPKERKLERHNLEEIMANSENLLKLINNILDLAKIEAGRQELMLEYVDMADVLGSVESVIAPLAQKKELIFNTQLDPNVPLIHADPEKIRRVIENLAGNAVKFTPQGGRVEILVDNIPDEESILIRVIDTGIGIPKDVQNEIFERFTQLDSSNSRKYGGTGLGLALAKELVLLHHGKISVKSEVNGGSTFMIQLPICPLNKMEEGRT
ncbi:c-type heme family protein [Desulfitobacterium sp.]|uniref:ATP-binding protein n=1 Tax=Desulfitobacterium sp. TaxID=49981 RepID=UPI002B1F1E80|nr:DUF3365 domain-containing protein [Desulfitobacterium sp.]MEA4902466.1 DUF3365 domain-containing protein [Desulfitobacterium sp.]